jgi:hypothetical protein
MKNKQSEIDIPYLSWAQNSIGQDCSDSLYGATAKENDFALEVIEDGVCLSETPVDDATRHLDTSTIKLKEEEVEEEHRNGGRAFATSPCPIWLCLLLVIFVGVVFSQVILRTPSSLSTSKPDSESKLGYYAGGKQLDEASATPSTCNEDGTCQIIMAALTTVLPASGLTSIQQPGTCQFGARDWLRVNKDILVFTPERIRQRYALAVFFCETNGKMWLENELWLSDMHECDWYNGVGSNGCDRKEQLVVLRLNDNGLHGQLPSELSLLTSLQELTVSSNLIYGTFPEEYVAMTNLDTLCLSFNIFAGVLPNFVFSFEDMVYFDISYNNFLGTIPEDLPTTMPNLQILFAQNNGFSGTIPKTLGDCSKLVKLHLDNNDFHGTIPAELGDNNMNAHLKQLHLHRISHLTGTIPSSMWENNALTDVSFHYNPELHGEVPTGLCELEESRSKLSTFQIDCEHVICECCSCITGSSSR